MRLPSYGSRPDNDEDEEEEDDGEVEILAQDEDELDAETEQARESILEFLRELLDDFMQGVETSDETLAELQADLAEWESDLHQNPFEPAHPELAYAWTEATNNIRDGYRLIIMGIEREQPEFFQAGYLLIEEGIYGREAVLNAP